MRAAPEQTDLQTVARGGDDPGAPADGPGRSNHHVLAEHDVRLGKAVKEPVINHRLSALPGLLSRLEHRHHSPVPSVAGLREEPRRAERARQHAYRGRRHA